MANLLAALTIFAMFDEPGKVEAWLKENKVPALGIGVIRDGKLREVKVYGHLHGDVPAPYDTGSR